MALFVLMLPQLCHADVRDDYFKAVMFDSSYEIASLLKKGVSPNLTEPKRGDSGLILALREESMEVFDVLVKARGINLEHRMRNGDNALMIAVWKQNQKAVTALLNYGAHVNRRGWTALHYAAAKGDNKIVRMLLDQSADLDARSPTHITPLMMAARNGHIYTVKLLHEKGADATLTDIHGRSMMTWAEAYGHMDIAVGMTRRLKMIRQRKHERFVQSVANNPPVPFWLTARVPPMD